MNLKYPTSYFIQHLKLKIPKKIKFQMLKNNSK